MSAKHFTVVELTQRSTAWLEWRHGGTGASEGSTIMGESRFQKESDLLREKRGPIPGVASTPEQERGVALEPVARKAYIAATGKRVNPVCLQSTRYEWLRASLDGITAEHDQVVEIKCGSGTYWTAHRTGEVPDYYYGQVQHILAVTGLKALDFWCYSPGYEPILFEVPRDAGYIKRLLQREEAFWKRVIRRA